MDKQELKTVLLELQTRTNDIKVNVFKIELKKQRLTDIESELAKEEVWSNLDLSQKLSKEKTSLEKIIKTYQGVSDKLSDAQVLLDVSIEENDDSSFDEISDEITEISKMVEGLEFSRMFTNKMDPSSAYIEIQSGSGAVSYTHLTLPTKA